MLLGAVYGSLFAALCNGISHSILAGGVIVFFAALQGAWAGRLVGFIIGSIYGVLFVALGNGVGGSTLGIVVTILGCALFGGWLQWAIDRRVESRARREDDCRSLAKRTIVLNREDCSEKELVLCN